MNAGRIIIGATEIAGKPISAAIVTESNDSFPLTTIRWRLKGGTFVLEQWKLENPKGPTRGIWVEVGCLV